LIESSAAWCLDIQDRSSQYTACFTKSYGRYIKGTGSVLLCADRLRTDDATTAGGTAAETQRPCLIGISDLNDPSQRQFDPSWWEKLKTSYLGEDNPTNTRLYLRYFKPKELLNIFGFPKDFEFPENISRKKQYELIGNSVNVIVIRHLLASILSVEERPVI
jgi:tRNA (cytosine38-C5)-methyltransferase